MRNKNTTNRRKLIALLALIIVVGVAAVGCKVKNTATIEVGNEQVTSLYSVVGEKKIKKQQHSKEDSGAKTQLVYRKGALTIGDVNNYIAELVNEEDYLVTQQAASDGTAQTYQISKSVPETSERIQIDFHFVEGGETIITYTLAGGSN